MKRILILIAIVVAIPSLIIAQERLVVQDGSGEDVFKVSEDGIVFAGGEDERNAFQLFMAGAGGGDSHVQIATNQANSRMTVKASTADDVGPGLFMIGPEDASSGKGAALIYTGSFKFDLPDAHFQVRHYQPGNNNYVVMMHIHGREAVVFPDGEVVVGIRTTNPQYPLQVTTGGAYCDGSQWVNQSSRDAKENIAELSKREAFETLRNIKPVKFNYKKDEAGETNVGFIAEDVPELVATEGRKGLVSMEVVAVLTKVVQEQQELISSQQKAFSSQQKAFAEQKLVIAELTERIKDLEER